MSRFLIRRVPNGWVDTDLDGSSSTKRFKVGEIYPCDIVEMRNGAFFKKWWALVKVVYDIWSERMPEKVVNGKVVGTSFERFRKDITIMAGHYEPIYNAKGEVRLDAASIAWASMDEETFAKLYSDTINAALQKILPNMGLNEKELNEWVERVLMFA